MLLRKGDQGQRVRTIQEKLREEGYDPGPLDVALSRCRTLEGLTLTSDLPANGIRPERQAVIAKTLQESEQRFAPAKARLGDNYSYGEIRMVAAARRHREGIAQVEIGQGKPLPPPSSDTHS